MRKMRELKFRAWDMADQDYWEPKGMVYFDLLNIPEFIAYTFCPKNSDRFVRRFKIMQFTGLYDKNGREIYEGDIIIQFYDEYDRQVVKYDVDRAGFYPFASGDGCGCCEHYTWWPDSCVVIGNIYQNPELLLEGANNG